MYQCHLNIYIIINIHIPPHIHITCPTVFFMRLSIPIVAPANEASPHRRRPTTTAMIMATNTAYEQVRQPTRAREHWRTKNQKHAWIDVDTFIWIYTYVCISTYIPIHIHLCVCISMCMPARPQNPGGELLLFNMPSTGHAKQSQIRKDNQLTDAPNNLHRRLRSPDVCS